MAKEKISAISVIIPMYNTEKYIAECLTSVLNQTQPNIEVIVIDDCSTDNSFAIAEKFTPIFSANNKKLLIYKTQKNSGFPGIPRNSALKVAQGKYIYFLDSDDFISETALEDFYKVAEKYKADVVHSEKYMIFEEIDGEWKETLGSTQTGEFVEKPTLETSDIGNRLTDFMNKRYLWWGCNKLFLKEFLLKNEIKFPQITSFEDLIFTFQCVTCAKNYVRVPFVSYFYRLRPNSLSQRVLHIMQVLYNQVEAIHALDKFMLGKKFFNKNSQYKYAIFDFFMSFFSDSVGKNAFIDGNTKPGEFYNFMHNEIFSKNPESAVPMASYLFVATNIYKLILNQQAEEIQQLKNLLAESQKNQ